MSNYLPTVFGENLMDVFDDFDRNFFRGFGNVDHTLYGKHAQNVMKTDVKETDDGYEVDIDLPGFKKDEVNVELNDGYLTISAAKGLDRDERDKKGRYIRQERYSGACSRSFYVGDVKPDEIKAGYEDGILRLEIPKREAKAASAPAGFVCGGLLLSGEREKASFRRTWPSPGSPGRQPRQ